MDNKKEILAGIIDRKFESRLEMLLLKKGIEPAILDEVIEEIPNDESRNDETRNDETRNDETRNDETRNENPQSNECVSCVECEIDAPASQTQEIEVNEPNYQSNNQRWFSDTISDPNGANEDEMFHATLGKWYKWRERISDFGEEIIEEALNKLLDELKNEDPTEDMKERDQLKQCIIEEWQRSGGNYDNVTTFAREWVENRNTHKLPKEITYSVRSITDFIRKWSQIEILAFPCLSAIQSKGFQ